MCVAGFNERDDRVNEITVNKNIYYGIFGRMEEREEEKKIFTTVLGFFITTE